MTLSRLVLLKTILSGASLKNKDSFVESMNSCLGIDQVKKEFVEKSTEEWNKTLESNLIEEKTKEWPVPSGKLRFSVQVPCYNEMPVSGDANLRGNLAEFLMGWFNAFKYYRDGGGDQDGEVLLNINNKTSDNFVNPVTGKEEIGTLANFRSLKMIESLNRYAKGEIELEEAVAFVDWLGEVDDRDRDQTFAFYRRLFVKGKDVLDDGLKLLVSDCTDGSYITAVKTGDAPICTPTQGARRRLLSEIGDKRLVEGGKKGNIQPGSQFIFSVDADSRCDRRVMVDFAGRFTDVREPVVFISMSRFVREKSRIADYDIDLLLNMRWKNRELTNALNAIYKSVHSENNKKINIGMIGSPMLVCFNQLAYEANDGYNIALNSREDGDFVKKLRNSSRVSFLPYSVFTIVDRVREKSFYGKADSRLFSKKTVSEKDGEEYLFVCDNLDMSVINRFLKKISREWNIIFYENDIKNVNFFSDIFLSIFREMKKDNVLTREEERLLVEVESSNPTLYLHVKSDRRNGDYNFGKVDKLIYLFSWVSQSDFDKYPNFVRISQLFAESRMKK